MLRSTLSFSFILNVVFASAQFDHALAFDGDESHVLIPHHPAYNMTNAMTIEVRVWAADYDPGGWQEFVYKGGNAPTHTNTAYRQYYIRPQDGNGRAQFKIHDEQDDTYNSKSDSTLAPGACYHLAGVFDGYTTKMYVNGILEDVDSTGGVTLQQDTGVLAIARQGSRSAEEFAGEIGEVRLWNTARTAEQICMTMNDTLPPAYYTSADSGLVGYWRLNEGAGLIAYDLSIHSNHGELRDGPDPIPACSSPSCILSIQERVLNVRIGPNPVYDQLFVNSEEQILEATIIDLSGRMVRHLAPNETSFTVPVSDLRPGLYQLSLNSKNSRVTKKVLVLH